MSTLFYQKHQDLVNSHFILKQVQSKQYPLIKIKNVFAQLSFFQLDSFQNEKTVETFFILRLLTKQKA